MSAMWTNILVNLAMIVEKADESVLPAVFLSIAESLSATPTQLGALTTCRALAQTAASPLSGILGDRYDRVTVLAFGCMLWGVMTFFISLCSELNQAMVLSAVNGIGLALVIPCSQSLVADINPAERRGKAFGFMGLTGAIGGMAGSFFATNMGRRRPWGIDGWRFAFMAIAAAGLGTGLSAWWWGRDPRFVRGKGVHVALTGTSRLSRPLAPLSGHVEGPPLPVPSPRVKRSEPQDLGPFGAGPVGSTSASSAVRAGRPWIHGRATRRSPSHSGESLSDLANTEPQALGGSGPSTDLELQPLLSVGSSGTTPGGSTSGSGLGSGLGARPKPLLASLEMLPPPPPGLGLRRSVAADLRWLIRMRSFQVIVVQGVMGCFPWQAIVFVTLWLQLQGFSDLSASVLMACFSVGAAFGTAIGGAIGDAAAKRYPNSGRIATAQVSVVVGIPLFLTLFKVLPGGPWRHAPVPYALVLFTTGLTCTWANSACNSPIFADIVPPEMRATTYAFDRSFENSLAACAAPVVGLLAERMGFRSESDSGTGAGRFAEAPALAAANAAALADSLALCVAVPWAACALMYSALHWTYPADRAALQRQGQRSDK